jgi:hypothetical protein
MENYREEQSYLKTAKRLAKTWKRPFMVAYRDGEYHVCGRRSPLNEYETIVFEVNERGAAMRKALMY